MVSLGDACPKILWNGQQFRAMPSGARQGSDNTPGGFSLDADMSLAFLVGDFGGGPFPDTTQVVVYPAVGGDGYKISFITIMAGQRVGKMTLEAQAQGL